MARARDTIIECPRCGKPQSRYQYETECCWECGSIVPIPAPRLRDPVRDDMRLQDLATDEPIGTDDAGAETVDESGITKMTEL